MRIAEAEKAGVVLNDKFGSFKRAVVSIPVGRELTDEEMAQVRTAEASRSDYAKEELEAMVDREMNIYMYSEAEAWYVIVAGRVASKENWSIVAKIDEELERVAGMVAEKLGSIGIGVGHLDIDEEIRRLRRDEKR